MVSIFDNPILDNKFSYDDEPTIPISDVTSYVEKLPTDSGQFSPNVKLISVFAPTTPCYNSKKKTRKVWGSYLKYFNFWI